MFRFEMTEKRDNLTTECYYINPNLDCTYTFPIDLVPNGINFRDESIGKVYLQFKFSLI